MAVIRDVAPLAVWSQDQLDSPSPPVVQDAYFDDQLEAWVLSRHADILSVFRISSLLPISPTARQMVEPASDDARLTMRQETLQALSMAQLSVWRCQLEAHAGRLAQDLPTEEPVDLMARYAIPICLSAAAMITGISLEDAQDLEERAGQISAASAEPHDAALHAHARQANIGSHFCSGPESLRESGFVAMSQTMPRILGNAWFALQQHPREWQLLHRQPALSEQAVDELLRYTGLARTITRIATEDIRVNRVFIRRGERIILRIIAGNRDPCRFPNPNEVDISRNAGGHFTLGAGLHSCVAAGLIRMAAATITRPLVELFSLATLDRPVEWHGGSGFRSPKSLWVTFIRGIKA